MLIDQIDPYQFSDNKDETILDSIIFYIDEPFNTYESHQNGIAGKNFDEHPLVSWVPYNNFVIHFQDGFAWFVAQNFEDHSYYIQYNILKKRRDGRNESITLPGQTLAYLFDKENLVFYNALLAEKNAKGKYEFKSLADDGIESMPPAFIDGYYILHRFLNILSCKNIKAEEYNPPENLQKRRVKNGKKPLRSYYELKIKPISQSSNAGSKGNGNWSNRVHLCRGHMKEYGEEKPLFGKYVGRFWFPPHVRGNKKEGIVDKNYILEHY